MKVKELMDYLATENPESRVSVAVNLDICHNPSGYLIIETTSAGCLVQNNSFPDETVIRTSEGDKSPEKDYISYC